MRAARRAGGAAMALLIVALAATTATTTTASRATTAGRSDDEGGAMYMPCVKGIACAELARKGAASKEIVVFGGEFSRAYARNETWTLQIGGKKAGGDKSSPWRLLSTASEESPTKRWKASLTALGGASGSRDGHARLLLFGGSASDEAMEAGEPSASLYDDLWELAVSDDGADVSWTRLGPKPAPSEGSVLWPPARRAHSAVALQSHLVIFGGRGPNGQTLRDLWAYDANGGGFSTLQEFPGEPRKGHTACMFLSTFVPANAEWASAWGGNKGTPSMIVFAGRKNSAEYLNDVWAFTWDGSASSKKQNWVRLERGGSSHSEKSGELIRPSKRNHHSAVIRENIMLVFGGRSSHVSYEVHDDLWAFDVVTTTWTQVNPITPGHEQSAGRMEHCAVMVNNNKLMAIVAGQDGSSQRRNDAWTFNIETGVWTEVAPPQCVAPVSRVLIIVSLAILGVGGLFVLYRIYVLNPNSGYRAL